MDGLPSGDIDMSQLMMAPAGYFTLPSSVASPYDDEDAVSSTSGSGSCPDSPVLSVAEAAAEDEKMVSAPVPAVGSLLPLPVAPPAGHFFALAAHGAPQLPPPPAHMMMQQQQQEAPQLPPATIAQTGPGRVIRGRLTRASPSAAPAPAPARPSRKRARGSSPEDDDEYEEEEEDEDVSAAVRRAAAGPAGGVGGRRGKGGASAAPKQQRATKRSKNAAGAAVPVVDGKLLTDLVETYKEKQDKLKHKAKLARDSRRKKKERLEQLEGEVARLNALLAEEKALREQEQAAAAKASVCICSALTAEMKAAAVATPAAAAAPAPASVPLADSVQRAAQNITSKYTEHLHTMMKQFPHAPPFACTSRNLEADLAKSAALSGLAGKDAAEHAKAVTATHLNFDAAMETLADGFTGALKTRGEVVERQLAALEKALEPPMALYFLEWLMTQPDMFYLDPAGIWSKLVHQTLAVSQQQLQALFTLRATIRAQRNAETDLRIQALGLNASLMAFAAMRSASAAAAGGNAAADTSAADVSLFSALPQQIAAHMSMHRSFQVFTRLARLHLTGLEGYIKGLRAILSPAQLALFFAFVEENAAVCTLVH